MTVRQISSIKTFSNTNQRKILLTSLVLSQLDYCNAILFNVNDAHLKQLQTVQNCAVKLIFDRRKYDTGLNNLFVSLRWLKVKQRIIYKILLLVHKSIYCQSPAYLNNLLTISNNFIRTGNLVSLKVNNSSSDGAFSVCAPKLWNALPCNIKFESCTVTFKRKLKTHLFHNN